MIPFTQPATVGRETAYVHQALSGPLSGGGPFTRKCQSWLRAQTGTKKALLTPSCTAALEMAALLVDIRPGDEVILPSFTFSSTATAFALRGARLVFVDIRPDTLNIDETKIAAAISDRTKAIIAVHYAGVACEMDTINEIAAARNIWVIEDAAQGLVSQYKGRPLGTLGHLGCISFHETKNVQCGEGGALFINDARFLERAEILREKGTNRMQFLRREITKYEWVDIGSSFLLGELSAAYLLAQLEMSSEITSSRLEAWNTYHAHLAPLADEHLIRVPAVPPECRHNGHIYALRLGKPYDRQAFIDFLKLQGVHATFHYAPLHSSIAGRQFGEFRGEDVWTTRESSELVRLPMHYHLSREDQDRVIASIYAFFGRPVPVPSESVPEPLTLAAQNPSAV